MSLPRLCLIALLPILLLAASCGTEQPRDPLGRHERAWVKEHGPIKVGMKKDYPPFSFLDKRGQPAGISVGLWQFMAQKLGFEVEFVPGKLKDVLRGLKDGGLDSAAGMFPTPERRKFLDFSKPYYPVTTSIFVYYQVKNVDGVEDLSKVRVGVVKGDSGQAIKEKAGYKPILFYTFQQAVQALGEGKVDALVMDNPVLLYYRKHLGLLEKIEWADNKPVVDRNDLALPVKKGNEVLLRILNKGLAAASGSEMQHLRERWHR